MVSASPDVALGTDTVGGDTIKRVIEIEGNMKDTAGAGHEGTDWCSGNPLAPITDVLDDCIGAANTECGELGTSPPGTCDKTVDDRFYTGGGSKDEDAIDCTAADCTSEVPAITQNASKCWLHVAGELIATTVDEFSLRSLVFSPSATRRHRP
jgi:hypothetical protein